MFGQELLIPMDGCLISPCVTPTYQISEDFMFGQELLIQVLLCNYLSHTYRWESEGSGGGGGSGQWGRDRVGEKRTGKMGEGGISRKIEGEGG